MRTDTQTCQAGACQKDGHFTVYQNRTGSFRVGTYQPRGLYCLDHAKQERDRKNAERNA